MKSEDFLKHLLDELRALPSETEWCEFKVSNCKPQEIGEYISALSNSACLHEKDHAYLVFGIETGTHVIKGTKFQPRKEKVGNEELENWLATQLNPRIDFEIIEFKYENFPIVLIKIDPSNTRPVAFRSTKYIRVGSYKKKLSDHPEKERKIWERTNKKVFEKEMAAHNCSGDEVLGLLDYKKYFSLIGLPFTSNPDFILEKFIAEKLIVKNRDRFNITNLGAILFASNLEAFEGLARKSVRVIIYKGKNRLHTVKEKNGRKGYAAGFEELIQYISDQLPTNEEVGKALRRQVKMYPEIAVRELIANALIHQDFRESGTGSMVEIFDDRMEISNPGRPLISTMRFIDHNPQSRNEKLAHFMRRTNICEERGSGIDKVVSQCELFQLPAPEFLAGENSLKAILYSQRHLKRMSRKDKIRACYFHCCLKYVSNELMTNTSLRDRFKIEKRNYAIISRIIADSIGEKLIKDFDPSNKSRKFAKYIPIWA